MSTLTIELTDKSIPATDLTEGAAIAAVLSAVGIGFERWTTSAPLPADAPVEAILTAYAAQIDVLKEQYGFQSVDVARMNPTHPAQSQGTRSASISGPSS